MKIGRLIYRYQGKRAGNIGEDIFLRHISAYPVEDVTPEVALSCDVLLVSIPSTYQYIDYLKVAKKFKFDARKNTKIVVGGYGAINPHFLTGMYDYFVLGRVHSVADEILKAAITGDLKDFSFVITPDDPYKKVEISQDPLCEEEFFCGCPYRCKFCQYSHVRALKGARTGYIQDFLTGGRSPELMLKDIPLLNEKPGRLRAALDGYSERLRYAYGKKIKNEDLALAITHLGSLAAGKTPVVLTLYNIANFPGETEDDYAEFETTIAGIAEPKGRVIVAVYSTSFRPSPLTPMEYMEAGTFPSLVPNRLRVVRDTPNLLVKHAYSLEGPYSAMQCTLIERCGPENVDACVKAVLSPRVGQCRSEERARLTLDKYGLWGLIGPQSSLPTDNILSPSKKGYR